MKLYGLYSAYVPPPSLRVVIIKPSKYGLTGHVERFRRGFIPNSTISHVASMTPQRLGDSTVETVTVDEYVQTDLGYLKLLHGGEHPVLLALVGVQSHQLQRALDLAAYALVHGVEHAVIGGPHVMTCGSSILHGRGLSFALSEAEMVRGQILEEAINGGLRPVDGGEQRWQRDLDSPVSQAPRETRHWTLRLQDGGRLSGERLPVHLQFLLGHSNRGAARPQPESRHDDGEHPDAVRRWRAARDVHLR